MRPWLRVAHNAAGDERFDRGVYSKGHSRTTKTMTIHAFAPTFMKVGLLTAALQERKPREVRDAEPDRASEEWVDFAGEIGASHIQLSAALHLTESDACRRTRCSIRWRTRSTCANRSTTIGPSGSSRRSRPAVSGRPTLRISTTCCTTIPCCAGKSTTSCGVSSTPRRSSASTRCGGFVGRNQQHSMDENLIDFEAHFVPLLKAKARGLTYRVEQCPMPGWTTGDNWHNNIAYTPGTWIALHRLRDKHGVGDQFRFTTTRPRDPDGTGYAVDFSVSERYRLQLLIGGFTSKAGDRCEVWPRGHGGQTVERGDAGSAVPSPRPADQVNAWKQVVFRARAPGHRAHAWHGRTGGLA